MKEYLTPEFEMLAYEAEDCLKGSLEVPFEEQDVSYIIEDLFGD